MGLAVTVLALLPWRPATAESLDITARLTPTKSLRLDFEDGSGHFVLFVRREGTSEGTGLLAGAKVTEYGMHDLVKGEGGNPRGYLVFRSEAGDLAYLKWSVKAVFVPRDGKRELADYGYWEVVGATGAWEGLKGVGVVQIKPAGGTARYFVLNGELGR